ncbi:CASP-like protein 2B1 [Wolffia australiana]
MSSGVGASPGNVPVYYGSTCLKAADRRLKVAELVLRCLICGLSLAAAVIVGTDEQVRRFFSMEKKAQFTNMKALVFLVVANGITSGYSLLQCFRCGTSISRGSALRSKPLAWIIFVCDQAMAYVTSSALAASFQTAMLAQRGQPEFQWMKLCVLYKEFCRQVGEGIALAIFACLGSVALSCVSAFNLFRLYGKNKGRETSTW